MQLLINEKENRQASKKLVDSWYTGRDSFAFSPKAKIKVRLGLALAGGAHPRRIQMGSSPSCTKKKNHTEWCGFFLVDDIGLEPMTFRTSSGCSSQLS